MIWSQLLLLTDWPQRRSLICIGAQEQYWNEKRWAMERGPPCCGRAPSIGGTPAIASAPFVPRVPALSIFLKLDCLTTPGKHLNELSGIA